MGERKTKKSQSGVVRVREVVMGKGLGRGDYVQN